MNRILIGALTLILALPAVSLAQGSGARARGGYPATSGTNDPGSAPPYIVTKSLEGKIAEIKADQHLVIVEDKKGKRLEFKLDDNTRFRADKKTEYAGKKNLGLGDFETGQPVRVTYTASNNLAVEMRLRHVK